MEIPQPGTLYMPAANILVSQVGPPFSTDRKAQIACTVKLAVGAGNVTGELYAEFTTNEDLGWSRYVFPGATARLGLFTNLSGVALNADGARVTVTAATSGVVSLTVDKPPAGRWRWGWTFTSGTGASPNTITMAASYQLAR